MKIGDTIDRFQVVDKLGEGGMAAVFGVRHVTLGTPHALKVLTVSSGDVMERMVLEGRVQARLAHPNVVAVTDVLDVNGAPGLLMEYVSGPALDEWMAVHRPTLDESLQVFRGVLAGVAHAHSEGVVHRDLKPGNVMLALHKDGSVVPKVMDFGLAKSFRKKLRQHETRSGAMMGTPAYMPPEQIRDASSVDRRADIYALGCILYELCSGEMPYMGMDLVELFQQIATGDHVLISKRVPDLPAPIVDAIEGMMIVERVHRISDCKAVLDVLEDHSALHSLTAALARPTKEGLPPPRAFPTLHDGVLKPGSGGASAAHQLGRAPMPSLGTPALLPHRASTPPTPSPPPPPPPPAERTRSPWVAMAVVLLIGVGMFLLALSLGGMSAWWWSSGPSTIQPAPVPPKPQQPSPEPIVPRPVESPPVEPTVPQPVELTVPRPVPQPVEPTVPRPVYPPPDLPQPPAPVPEPPLPVLDASFAITAMKDLRSVVLIKDGVRYSPGRLPSGTYDALIQTSLNEEVRFGPLTIRPGAQQVICSPSSFLCRTR